MLIMESAINGLLEQKKLERRYHLRLLEIDVSIQKFMDLFLIQCLSLTVVLKKLERRYHPQLLEIDVLIQKFMDLYLILYLSPTVELKKLETINHSKLLESQKLIQKFMDLFLKLCLSATVAITGRKNLQQQNLKKVELLGESHVDGMEVIQILLDHIILILGYIDIVVKMCLLRLMNITESTETLKFLMQTEEDNHFRL